MKTLIEGTQMSVRFFRKTALLGGVMLLSVLILGTAEAAKPPGGHLNVTEVFVDFVNNELVITGEDFGFGPGPTVVTLGEVGVLAINSENDTLIVVALPAGGVLDDGDYLLTVSRGTGQSQNDEYDLTIGAVGPEGEQGEQGKIGDTGPQGVQGKIGHQGAPGIDGSDGAQGPQGKIGPQGDPGADGNDGAQGPQGPEGPSGTAGLLAAHVNLFGNGSGVGLISSTKLSTGKYLLTFDQNIGFCHRVASLGSQTYTSINTGFDGIPGEIYHYKTFGSGELVVVTYDSAGIKADNNFHVLVWCD